MLPLVLPFRSRETLPLHLLVLGLQFFSELVEHFGVDLLLFELQLVVCEPRVDRFHEEGEGLMRGGEYGYLDLRFSDEGNHVVLEI